MEANTAKASDRAVLNLKRKWASRCAASPTSEVVKRMRLSRCKSNPTNSGTHIGRSLVRYYSNYKKSRKPERLMVYQNGGWTDFPKDVVDLVRKDFDLKKAAVEVELNGELLVLNFLHMYQMDLKTGMQQPIAWIDETGCCFFPEIYAAADEEPYDFCNQDSGESHESLFQDPYESSEIKLHLEIEINGVDASKLGECSGESNAIVKHIQIDAKRACCQYDVEIEDSSNKKGNENDGEATEQNQNIGFSGYNGFVNGRLDLDTVQKMFLKGMSSFGNADIVDIYPCSSALMQARLELFEKQAEITKNCRGDANVQYAWLASSNGELSTMIKHGLGHCGLSASKCKYGIGVHLAAATCPYARLSSLIINF